ncbi:MAG TPA: OsmC family protein [bacterium]|jgi:putative redox protein|nr:OsmC family protein [Dictyoglomota bacterium]HHV81366.1 OsmC family protein [bacterium]HOK29999.1 OsmC family protein [bacterium]HOL55147.1 OsmC family protein [bacterium]HPO82481.1 OsmC family protein [bacterium]
MEAKVTWQKEGLRFVGHIDGSPDVIMDSENGPTPMELVLMALGGCTGMDVISILQKMRQDVKDFEVNLSAERAQEHPKIFTRINLEYVVYGSNIEENSLKRAIELSQEKYCGVGNMLKKAAEITYSWKIVNS